MNIPNKPRSCRKVHMTYLDELRALGTTNMYGAAPYLAMSFGLDHETAVAIVRYWQYTYSDRHPQASV